MPASRSHPYPPKIVVVGCPWAAASAAASAAMRTVNPIVSRPRTQASRPWSLDRDRAMQIQNLRTVVIMEPADARDDEIARFAALARQEKTGLIDLGAVVVFRMGIGGHVVRT